MTEAVVITGAGITTSLGHTVADVWTALLSGQSGIGPLQKNDAGVPSDHPDCPDYEVAAQVVGLDPSGLGIHPRDARNNRIA